MRFKNKNIYHTNFYVNSNNYYNNNNNNNNNLTGCVEIISDIEKLKLRLFVKTGEKIYLKCFKLYLNLQ